MKFEEFAERHPMPAQLLKDRIEEFVDNSDGDPEELDERLLGLEIQQWTAMPRDIKGFKAREDDSDAPGFAKAEPYYWLPDWDEWKLASEAEDELGFEEYSLQHWKED